MLIDASGRDTYRVEAVGEGAALFGVGALCDLAGSDAYTAQASCLGYAGPARPESFCLGMFLDEGGENRFPRNTPARPNSTWVQSREERPLWHGVGMSR